MNYTIFDMPVLRTLVRGFSIVILRILGWRTEGRMPPVPKFVLVGAPHTSNWDFPYGLFILFVLRIKVYWMGKEALFRNPFESFFKWLGGIPIDRSRSKNMVAQSIEQFNQNETLILLITPSGTRKRVKKWKTGFYYIAQGAKVPLVLGFLDYRRKVGGIGPMIRPTGDVDADMKTIRAFYKGVSGKYPRQSASFADDD